jgi:acetyltransferase-like isoleucine patch superfamily enzyme
MASPRLSLISVWRLKSLYWANRLRFSLLRRRLEGRVEFGPGCEVWVSRFIYRGEGRVTLGRGFVVDRGDFPFIVEAEKAARVDFGEECWMRGKYRSNVITAFAGAKVSLGPRSILNGAIISAKTSVTIGRQAMLSWNVSIMDSNLHPLSNSEPLTAEPVVIGDYVNLGAHVVILAGTTIGSHVVIGAGSVVKGEIPGHVVAAGNPARVIRSLSDRDLPL